MIRSLVVFCIVLVALGNPKKALVDPCCHNCTLPKVKYYSIDKTFNQCGECCMDPKDYPKFKIFEPGLTLATDNTPCSDHNYGKYVKTETHGIPGILSITLDMYAPNSTRS
eukprot:NODE_10784_length_491_cov_28.274457_g10132_i0.p1 GENE.NODE_10784_length_491_cov_28.274457_g10132_i0~~NODE_10784_length_491_cov_28.274457_g10132_i0.p1  ORF type:complete len:129 (-),score=18.06 NODE_10784_length_491_cov_28.274457_g10132_i0:103-435(-)